MDTKVKTGLLAFALVGGLAAFGLCGVLIVAHGPVSANLPSHEPRDPYSPDCAIARKYLRQQYGEFEVVSWGQRTITRSPELGDHVTMDVRFRTKSGRTKSALFVIGAGDLVESCIISD